MGPLLLFLSGFLFYGLVVVDGASFSEFVYPNFTASNLKFIEKSGAFLFSRNGTFKAAIFNLGAEQTRFYFCVIHVASNFIIWSANRDTPISSSGELALTRDGMAISDENGDTKWSTSQLGSPVYALQLTEIGNLVLLDQFNGSLWESFDLPTDTIVIGQQLPVGVLLSSAKSDDDLSTGNYTFQVTTSDAILQWQEQTYWMLSMDTMAYVNSIYIVDYMVINETGIYLLSHNGSDVVIQVMLQSYNFRIANLAPSGHFKARSFNGKEWKTDFFGPIDDCRIPSICGSIGLCTNNNPLCACPLGFHVATKTSGCVPDGYYSLPGACNRTSNENNINSSLVSYLSVGYDIDYFAIGFFNPARFGVNLSSCQDLCSRDCSCLGIFYENSSGSCYPVENELGSIISSDGGVNDLLGFIKAVGHTTTNGEKSSNEESGDFPVGAIVALLCASIFLSVAVGFVFWRKMIRNKVREGKLDHNNSRSSDELDAFYIQGLPQRFSFNELDKATDNFKNQIGSGGFGAVFKGTLPDKTIVAVKKITNVGIQGKKDFCTEIAVIGNIHHVNLVKLKGFCAQGRQRLLVYEYMNRGSLEKTLFGSGPVLEWQERVDVALGTARGLAYLHVGCEQKIIHCDVKPENILLHDQFQAKISDFGLSKLLSPEQSSLFTTMRGTRGYLAPEWLTNSAISEKTDVYSFGMVLFELVSGRKNCAFRSHSQSTDDNHSSHSSLSSGHGLLYFPLFALEMHEQRSYLELADSRLEGRVTSEEVEKIVQVALCCVHEEPSLRPSMSTVVSMLEGVTPIDEPKVKSLNFLRFYGRRFTEASMIEEENGQNDEVVYPNANGSPTSSTNGSHSVFLSFMSSQQVSGPR